MKFLNFIAQLFLLPGTLALGVLNIEVEQDGGVFRSLINMIFWGVVIVLFALPVIIKMNY